MLRKKLGRYLPFLIIFLIAFFLEIFVFNYKSIFSIGNKEKYPDILTVSDGLKLNGDGSYEITDTSPYIEISNINEKVKNIKLDISVVEDAEKLNSATYYKSGKELNVRINADDAANKNYFMLGKRTIVNNVEPTKYMNLHLAKKTTKIRIDLDENSSKSIIIKGISYNAFIPFNILPIRIGIVYLLIVIVYLLRPGSEAYKITYMPENSKQRLITLVTVVGLFYMCCSIGTWNPYLMKPRFEHHYQYQELAQSFAKGKLSLEAEPDEALKNMENPYDTLERAAEGVPYLWDRAYYNGKYYVYFGVLPEILFYYPIYMLTGADAKTYVAIIWCTFLFAVGFMYFMHQVVLRWFRNTSYIMWWVTSIISIFGSGVLFFLIRPDFYSVPIIMGLAFSIWGLAFWVGAKNEKGLSEAKLLAGSLCMALVSACRPQLLMMSFIAIPLFFDDVFKKKILIIGKQYKNTLSFVMPYVVVAAFVMWYNKIRFDSCFNFGANYNLTTNDMTNRGMELGRIGYGLFALLFQTPITQAKFPFMSLIYPSTNYLGYTCYENMTGGIIICNIITWIILIALIARKKLIFNSKVRNIIYSSFIIGLIVTVADVQMAGVLPRYHQDVAWIFMISSVFVIFSIEKYINTNHSKELAYMFRVFIMIAFVEGIIYNFLRMFMQATENIMESNPELYFSIMHGIAFWT